MNMFLTNKTRLKIKDIVKRISLDEPVALEERIYVEKFAKHNSTIWTWLKKANSLRRYGKQKSDGINGLIQNLGLDGLETENHFDPKNDDLADWFSGSPDWVRRSQNYNYKAVNIVSILKINSGKFKNKECN